jgi:hypothetical protein
VIRAAALWSLIGLALALGSTWLAETLWILSLAPVALWAVGGMDRDTQLEPYWRWRSSWRILPTESP